MQRLEVEKLVLVDVVGHQYSKGLVEGEMSGWGEALYVVVDGVHITQAMVDYLAYPFTMLESSGGDEDVHMETDDCGHIGDVITREETM